MTKWFSSSVVQSSQFLKYYFYLYNSIERCLVLMFSFKDCFDQRIIRHNNKGRLICQVIGLYIHGDGLNFFFLSFTYIYRFGIYEQVPAQSNIQFQQFFSVHQPFYILPFFNLYYISILIKRILMSHTGPVWAMQRKGDVLLTGSGDKTVRECADIYKPWIF